MYVNTFSAVDNLTSSMCSAMNVSDNGRWVTVPCSMQLLHACQNSSNIMLGKSGPWNYKDAVSAYYIIIVILCIIL